MAAIPSIKLNNRSIAAIVGGFLLLVVGVVIMPMLVEVQDAKDIMVIQYPTGELKVFTEPGPHAQWFGKVTVYPRQSQYSFCSTVAGAGNETKCPGATSGAERVRFSEGGHALLTGAVNWEMPLDTESILKIHKKFNSEEAIESMAVGKMLDSAVYFSGPLMTSTESSGARRGELVNYINDQAMNGIFVTESKQVVTKDATGEPQTVTVTEIVRDKSGHPQRQQGSILSEFNIKLQPISINELKYDSVVEKQIADRQASTTEVQLSMATTLKAEQQAKTAEAQGKAAAAEAKWKQETIKAQAVTQAEQELEVARLNAKAAEQTKRQKILEGEGEAAKARLVMQANGALEQKLAAYVKVNEAYAKAIAEYGGNWVPGTVIGSNGGSYNGAEALINMLNAKTAKDLSLDMNVEGGKRKKKAVEGE